MRVRDVLATVRHLAPRVLLGLVLLVGWAWCLGAIWFSEIGPPAARWAAMGLFVLVFPVLLLRGMEVRHVVFTFLAVFVAGVLLFHLRRPSLERDWVAEMARGPEVDVTGDRVTVTNVRNCFYRGEFDFDVRWEVRGYDLMKLRTLDFMVERFHKTDGPAHTFLSFGFGDDPETREYVTVSVEIRREEGESFEVLRALYRQYELLYVVADERDVLQLRTNYRRSRTYLFPVKTTYERMRAVFISMVERANALSHEPEYYNTATSTCTTNIVSHVNELFPGRVPMHLAVLLPGYSGRLAHEIGAVDLAALGLDGEIDFALVEEACRIDDDAQKFPDDPDFSRRVRAARRAVR